MLDDTDVTSLCEKSRKSACTEGLVTVYDRCVGKDFVENCLLGVVKGNKMRKHLFFHTFGEIASVAEIGI